ncbi:MAG: hypothetical protein AAFR61_15130 [Bacteroidota bacterium]
MEDEKMIFSPRIDKKIQAIINFISTNINGLPIEKLAYDLRAAIFNLGIELLEFFSIEDKAEEFLEKTRKFNLESASQHTDHPTLRLVLLEILSLHKEIESSITQSVSSPSEPDSSLDPGELPKINYENIKYLSRWPDSHFRNYAGLVNSQIDSQIGITISNLILEGELDISEIKIKAELIPFIRRSIKRLGGYAIDLEYWEPEEDHESTLVNSMEIFAARLEIEDGKVKPITKAEFINMLKPGE